MFYLLVIHKSFFFFFFFLNHWQGSGWNSRMLMGSLANLNFNPQNLNKISELLLLSVNSSKTDQNQCDSRCLFLQKVWLGAPLSPPFHSWARASTCPPHTTKLDIYYCFHSVEPNATLHLLYLQYMPVQTECTCACHPLSTPKLLLASEHVN